MQIVASRIGDATAFPQYERNLIKYYYEKKPFSIFDYIFVEILNISKIPLRNCGYAPQMMMMMMMIEKVTCIDCGYASVFGCSSHHHGCSLYLSGFSLNTLRHGYSSTFFLLPLHRWHL
jgi:hypothetical protein